MEQRIEWMAVLSAKSSLFSVLKIFSHQPAYLAELILHCLQRFLTTTVFIHYVVNTDVTVSSDVCNKAVASIL